MTYSDGEASCHPVEIVWMLAHCHDLGDNCIVRPLDAKYFGQLLQVLSRCFTDREDSISQPAHTERAELLVEEFYTKLTCEKRNVFDNSQSDSPLLILGQLYDSRKKRL